MTRRPTCYSQQIADQVCEMIREGYSLLGLYRDRGLPARSTVVRWRARYPEFRARYEAACRHRAAEAARLNQPDAGVGGRPTRFSDRLADRICTLIADGASMNDLNRVPGVPSPATIYRWMARDSDFRRDYAAMCALRADILADQVVTIADGALDDDWDTTPGGMSDAEALVCLNRAKLRIAAIKWRVGAMAPRKYGRKPADDDPATRPISFEDALLQLEAEVDRDVSASRQVGGTDLGGG